MADGEQALSSLASERWKSRLVNLREDLYDGSSSTTRASRPDSDPALVKGQARHADFIAQMQLAELVSLRPACHR
eukprot:1941733-Pyramimonas_sp.AAC.1